MVFRFILIIFILMLFSCSSSFINHGQKSNLSNFKIAKNDTFSLRNYSIRSVVTKSAPFTPIIEQNINNDSVLNFLKVALTKNYIPFYDKTDRGLNYRDSLKAKTMLRLHNFDRQSIHQMETENSLELFPIISFTNEVHFGGYVTSNAMAGDGGFKHFTQFYLILLITKNNKIIYECLTRYVSAEKLVSSFDEGFETPSGVSIKQEHWDELVRRTMRGYFKQVGK
jgi:hypothetical protein